MKERRFDRTALNSAKLTQTAEQTEKRPQRTGTASKNTKKHTKTKKPRDGERHKVSTAGLLRFPLMGSIRSMGGGRSPSYSIPVVAAALCRYQSIDWKVTNTTQTWKKPWFHACQEAH